MATQPEPEPDGKPVQVRSTTLDGNENARLVVGLAACAGSCHDDLDCPVDLQNPQANFHYSITASDLADSHKVEGLTFHGIELVGWTPPPDGQKS